MAALSGTIDPAQRDRVTKQRMKEITTKPVDVAALTSSFKAGSDQSTQSMDDPFYSKRIPVSYTVDLIRSDPFLTPPAKGAAEFLVTGKSDSGLISGKDLMQTAVQAGVGYGAAYMFGKVLGSVMSLPKSTVDSLANKGGIAAAIINTGVLEKIL